MKGHTIAELRAMLMATRGETREKIKEEDTRNQFLQTAADEIFQEHDWDFNRRVTTDIELDDEGGIELPRDFSPMNGWTLKSNLGTYKNSALDIRFNPRRERFSIYGASGTSFTLTYYILAPNIKADPQTKVYFPQPMLITDRAYVRLKTAYFPDETSDKELAQNKRELGQLWAGTQPVQDLTHHSWS